MSARHRNALVLALAALTLSACGGEDGAGAGEPVTAPLKDADGADKGTVEVSFDDGVTTLTVTGRGLVPGLHGLHVHKTGQCQPRSTDPAKPETIGAFLSAGGHLAQEGQAHGNHDGDLPSLLVRADGTAMLVVTSDRLTRASVLDDDGSALMLHEKADNFANVPERYTTALDETTTKTGDAGTRVGCAILSRG